jgi:hypothetical protein
MNGDFGRVAAVVLLMWSAAAQAQHYQQTVLVADLASEGPATVDPVLIDAWSIARSTRGPWVAADRASGVATVYRANGGKEPTTFTFPRTRASAAGSPTGAVFNGGSDFALAPGMPAEFIFVSLSPRGQPAAGVGTGQYPVRQHRRSDGEQRPLRHPRHDPGRTG